jgi:hypothetical protein
VLAGGINAYGFASGDPANYGDSFGLRPLDDITYNEYGKEINRVKSDQPDRYFLQHNGQTDQLDYALQEGSTPYHIVDDAAMFDKQAEALATETAPVYSNRLSIAIHSLPGGTLDFKRLLPDRSLFNAGGGLYVHKHAIGNAAWGYYMKKRGFPLSISLRGANVQGASVGGEDSLDQRMIKRGYGIP